MTELLEYTNRLELLLYLFLYSLDFTLAATTSPLQLLLLPCRYNYISGVSIVVYSCNVCSTGPSVTIP